MNHPPLSQEYLHIHSTSSSPQMYPSPSPMKRFGSDSGYGGSRHASPERMGSPSLMYQGYGSNHSYGPSPRSVYSPHQNGLHPHAQHLYNQMTSQPPHDNAPHGTVDPDWQTSAQFSGLPYYPGDAKDEDAAIDPRLLTGEPASVNEPTYSYAVDPWSHSPMNRFPSHSQCASPSYGWPGHADATLPPLPESVGREYYPQPLPLTNGPFNDYDYRLSPALSDINPAMSRAPRRQSRRRGSAGDSSSKPKKAVDKPWVRINGKTRGGNRTKKINEYNPSDKYSSQPNDLKKSELHGWESPNGFRYMYNEFGELNEPTLTVEQIHDFLFCHPWNADSNRRMKIWIQKVAADSGRRYPTRESDHCRFRDCPAQQKGKGTMLHGHYRVAFDENWNQYHHASDPFVVAGYVHLDCLERFLSLPDICRQLDVEVDLRIDFPSEPNGKFKAALDPHEHDKGAIAQALEFVEQVRITTDLGNYPPPLTKAHLSHWDFSLESIRHKTTLNYFMTDAKYKERPQAQRNQFQRRLDADRADRVQAGRHPDSNADYSNVLMHKGSVYFLTKAADVRKLEEKDPVLGAVRQARRDADNHAKGKPMKTSTNGWRSARRSTPRHTIKHEYEDEDELDGEADAEGEDDEVEEQTAEVSERQLRSRASTSAKPRRVYRELDENDDDVEDFDQESAGSAKRKRVSEVSEDSDEDDEWSPLSSGPEKKKLRSNK